MKTYSYVEINDGISCKLVLCMYLSTQCFYVYIAECR